MTRTVPSKSNSFAGRQDLVVIIDEIYEKIVFAQQGAVAALTGQQDAVAAMTTEPTSSEHRD